MTRKEEYFRQKANRISAREQKRAERWTVKAKEPLTLFTALLMISTIALAFVAWLQWRTFEKTDETFRAGERAFVISSELLVEPIKSKDGTILRWLISPIIENDGNSSTVDAEIVTGVNVSPSGTVDNALEPVNRDLDQKNSRHFVLGPKSKSSKITPPMHFTSQSLPMLRSGNPRMFVIGQISYVDVFEAPHITKYCYRVWAYPEDVGIPDITYSLCTGRSNCTDQECKAEK
jgi:hypothetical protein